MFKSKIFMAPIMSLIFVFCSFNPYVFAETTNYQLTEMSESSDDEKFVSRNEVIESIMSTDRVSYEEAEEILNQLEPDLWGGASAAYKYYSITTIADDGSKIKTWAYVGLWNRGSFRQFTEVLNSGSGFIGESPHKWEPTVIAFLASPTKLIISCRGYLTAMADQDNSTGLGIDFGAGKFSVNSSTKSTIYNSQRLTFESYWNLYI
ncbi:MAG: hypothetical protein LBV08_02830 [Clostridiales bacterium]|jgi:hypothetical protein|nr:hypothetical protein [Clostridiales bacterium]